MEKNKEELIEYLNDNYKRMFNLASSFVGKYNAPDLISESLLTIYNRKKPLGSIKNKFVYFYVIFKNLAFRKTSAYYKLIESSKYHKHFVVNNPGDRYSSSPNEHRGETYIDSYIEQGDNSDNIRYSVYEHIIKIADELLNNKEIDWYQHKLFKLFYDNESIHSIDDLDIKDISSKRNMSYRKLQNEIGIDYQSIRNSVLQVNNKIKDKLGSTQYHELFDKYNEIQL